MDQGAEISQQVLFTFSDFVNYLSPRLPEVCGEREREIRISWFYPQLSQSGAVLRGHGLCIFHHTTVSSR